MIDSPKSLQIGLPDAGQIKAVFTALRFPQARVVASD
jgi:hypothetical protein